MLSKCSANSTRGIFTFCVRSMTADFLPAAFKTQV